MSSDTHHSLRPGTNGDSVGICFGCGDSLRPLAASLRPLPVHCELSLPMPSKPRPARRARLAYVALIGLGAALSLCLLGASGHQAPARPPTVVVGAANPRTTSTGKQQRWHKPEVRVTLDPSVEMLGDGATDAVRAAFGTWLGAGAQLPSLVLENASSYGKAEHDGVNRVLASSIDIEGHKHDLAVTRSYVDDATGEILEADIIINLDYPFADVGAQGAKSSDDKGKDSDKQGQEPACEEQYDLPSIATHEVGHFFGLSEDWDESDTTMYYDTPVCDTVKRQLHPQDTQAMEGLYAGGFKSDEPGAACAISQGAGGRDGAWGLLLAWVATVRRVRRRKMRG